MRRLWLVIILGLLAGCGTGSSRSAAPADTPGSPSASAPESASASVTPTPSPTPITPSPTPSRSASPIRSVATPRTVALHYVFPVAGCAASPSSSHHDYPASDIFTKKGCRFVAVVAGRDDEVSYVDRCSPSHNSGAVRGGRSVSIVRDDGGRDFGRDLLRIAAGIKPGARVHAGQLLGLIDNSGDVRYTPTHVLFGISWPTRHGIWWVRRGEVWPQSYLRAWRNHHNLSPAPEVRRVHARMGTVPRCTAEC